MPKSVEVYSRRGCCLCDEAKATIVRVAEAAGVAIELVDVDIARSPSLTMTYGHHIPVVFVDGREIGRLRLDEATVRAALTEGEAGIHG
jgi:glutaredoxin